MPFDDEFPTAPQPGDGGAATATQEVDFDTHFDAKDLEGVGKLGDIFPIGTYHFRLDKYTKAISASKIVDGIEQGGKPYFNLQWKCQEEPYTGRMIFDMVSWVESGMLAKARAGDSAASQEVKRRLVAANSLMADAGYKVTGGANFVDFLNTNPEVKIQLNVRERKLKNEKSGKYDLPSGEMQNNIVKYLSLTKPR